MKFLIFSLCVTFLNYVLLHLLTLKLKRKYSFQLPKSDAFDKLKSHITLFVPILNVIFLIIILVQSDDIEKRFILKYGIAENSACTTK
jgi:uncharacterized membrane protein